MPLRSHFVVCLILLLLSVSSAGSAKKVAVQDFSSVSNSLKAGEGELLGDALREGMGGLPEASFVMMTRENITELLPPGKTLEECTEGQCEVEIGRKLGADYLVIGKVLRVGKSFVATVKAHRIQPVGVLLTRQVKAKGIEDLQGAVTALGREVQGKLLVAEGLAPEGSENGAGSGQGPSPAMSNSAKVAVPDEVGTIVTLSAKGGAATFSLDGKPVCRDQDACQQELSNGKHVVMVARAGYRDTAFSIAVPRGENRYSVGLNPKLGILTIRAQDEGTGQALVAEILVDGTVVGKTPKSIAIPLLARQVLLRAQDHEDIEVSERPEREGDKVSVVARFVVSRTLRPPPGDVTPIVAGIDAMGITKAQVEKLIDPLKAQIADSARKTHRALDEIAQPLRRQACAKLLVQAVVEAEVKRLNLVPDVHKVDSVYKVVTAQFPDSASLLAALARSGDNPASIKEKIGKQVVANELMQKALEDSLKIPPARIDSFFQANKDMFSGVGQVRGRHILLLVKSPADSAKVHAEIEAIHGKLSNDLSQFATIARAKSEDPGSRDKGGDLGWFDPKEMVPEFAATARSLEPGKVSKPFRTQFGWHILQIQERKIVKAPVLDSVKSQIEDILKSQAAERIVPAYYRRLLKAHNLKYLDASYKEPSLVDDP